MDDSYKRIEMMESYLNESRKATDDLSVQLDNMEQIRDKMIALFEYYGSAQWYDDRDLPLPEGLAAGVLSEDLVYDVITDLRDAAFRMLELSTDILKSRI